MMKHLFSIWLILITAGLYGQRGGIVNGRVLDTDSGEPMVAVNISADRRTGTISGEAGEFSLSLSPGTHLIEFYYVGYEVARRSIRLAAGETVALEIEMNRTSKMLDEVVVSAGKYEQKLSDVTVSLELLKPYQLSNQNITSLDMILERTSGVSILDGQPSIRGGSGFSYGVGSRVLMLVDDLPMISGDAGDIKWNYMPVENLHQVEVIKGASSVLHGSSALNGVINFRTRFPGNEPETEVTLHGGVYMKPQRRELVWWERNPLFGGVSFSHLRMIGNLELTLGGNYFKNEGYRELEHEQRGRGNVAVRYRFQKVRGLTAGISANGMLLDAADFLLWQNADSGAYRQNPETWSPLTGHRYNIDPSLEYVTPEGDKHSLKTRIYSVGNSAVDTEKSSFSNIYYAEYRYLKRFGEQVNWTSGISFSRNTVIANLYENHRGSNTAAYSQLDANPLNRLKVSAGIRWEMNTLNGTLYYSIPVVRVGTNYQAGSATYLRASFGQGYRFPSVAEKYASAEVGGLRIFKNPDLEPERGWSAEAGLKQGFSLGGWMGFADLALFWTEYANMIEYTFGVYPKDTTAIPTFDDVGFKALNIGTARITGAELSLNGEGRMGPLRLRVTGGYTFMNPVDPGIIREEGRGEDEAFILKYRRRHLVKADAELEAWRLFAGANVQYNSRMVNVDEVFIDPLTGNLLQPGFPEYWNTHATGYFLADFRLGWNIVDALRVNVILRNAFNREYLGRPGDIGPPRNFTLQVRLTF
ncbi:MAG TPA: TonB-dependent receptor [Bacteroides sp.]|mgnify:CR=1 FL=1|nr:TonB-dependent receptor [Bacteroides sp.]